MADAIFSYPDGLELASGNALWSKIVALYPLNSTNDDAKNGFDGIRYGTGTAFNTTTERQIGSACGSFNGIDDYIACGNIFSTPQTEITVGGWLYIDNFNQSPGTAQATPIISNWNRWLVGSQKGFSLMGWHIALNLTQWQFNVCDGTDYADVVTLGAADADFTSMYAGRWLQVFGVFKASTYMRIFIDGTMVAEKTSGVPAQMEPDTSSNDWLARTGVHANYMDGRLDEMVVFNSALLDTELVTLKAEQDPTTVTIPNFESLPLERPSEKFQSSQVLGGGDIVIQDLGKTVQYVKLNINYLSKAKYDELVTFFQTTVNYMEKTFSFTDQLGTVYNNMRLTKPSFSLPRVTNNSDAMYSGQLLLKSEPA